MTIKFIEYTEEDGADVEIEHELPSKFEVCDRCRGSGQHVNPAVDGNGLTAEDFAEDPDFEESYFRGDYDVTCEQCGGLRVEEVVDDQACEPGLLEKFYESLEREARYRREDAYARRMGF